MLTNLFRGFWFLDHKDFEVSLRALVARFEIVEHLLVYRPTAFDVCKRMQGEREDLIEIVF